ncbi:MAG: calcium-binding protein [Gammaproteobacteria bacterium]
MPFVSGLPTYGDWGGPGWSAGIETNGEQLTPAQKAAPWQDPLDKLFKTHDLAYEDAMKLPTRYDQSMAITRADRELIMTMLQMDISGLSVYGLQYRKNAIVAFTLKLAYDEWSVMGNGVMKNMSDRFNAAKAPPPRRDPLALDLDGDGIETVAENGYQGVLFDHNGDGVKTATGWVGADDGLLVWDRNGNGMIDNGAELFGDNTLQSTSTAASGFNALRDLNTNGDGRIDAADAQFANLRVWRDLNQDGASQANELFTLGTFGITSLDVGYTSPNTALGNGNSIARQGSFTRADGSTGTMGDMVLRESTLEREFVTPVAITAPAAALPELQGAGMVRDLREAVSLDSTGRLVPALTAYSSATTRSGQLALIDDVIKAWGETSTMKTSLANAREPFRFVLDPSNPDWTPTLATFGGSPPLVAIVGFKVSHPEMYQRIIALEQFNGTTLLEHWIIQVPTGSGNMIGAPMSVLIYTPEQEALAQNSYNLLRDYVYQGLLFQTRLKPYADAIGVVVSNGQFALDFSPVEAMFAQKLTGDSVNGLTDIIEFVKYGQGMFTGSSWDGYGYLLNTLRSVPMTDAVQGVLAEFNVRMDGAAGTVINGTAKDDITLGGGGNDNLSGQQGNDLLFGEAGNDYLFGGEGNDALLGSAGNDALYGGAGNDILEGGSGNDSLMGDAGADTYLFGKGSGQDTIYNYDSDALGTNTDTVLLGAGITTTDVTLTRLNDSLYIGINGTDDRLEVQSYFSQDGVSSYGLEAIKFADGTTWDVAAVKAKVLIPTTGNDMLTGYASNDTISGGDGNDTLSGQAGDDVLDGGTGADSVQGGDGNDTIKGGSGVDYLSGGNGNDTLQGNEHNDTLYGDAGNDTLDGGSGNDYLGGGTGADTYLFGKGSGQDTIYNYDSDALGTNTDTVLLGAGITTTDVTLTRLNDSLYIGINGTDDRLEVQSYFSQDGVSSYGLEAIKFADGTTWDVAAVKAKVLIPTTGNDMLTGYASNDTISGGDGNDTLSGQAGDDVLDGGTGADSVQGGDGNDTIKGGSGVDYLSGGNGNDTLQGNEHNDTLYGDAGNDTLDGGSGNDYLGGGTGADTYLFGKGSGQDTIYNYDSDALGTNTDTVLLGAGITTTDVTLTRLNDSLYIGINGTDDRLEVQSYFSQDGVSSYGLEAIKFADGTTWDVAAVKAKVLIPTTGNDMLTGYASNDTISGGDGNDTLSGQAGDDVLDGGTGADSVQGGDGNDTIKGGSGVDYLSGGNGNDTLQGNEHNDTLYGDAGNDTLDGGSGNDYLGGGTGADTYLFGKGSGQDTIYNYDSDALGTNTDTVLLGAGITTTDVTLTRLNDSLYIGINGTDDRLEVQSYFSQDGVSSYGLEAIKFADGTTWNYVTAKSKLSTATTPASVTVSGTAASEVLTGGLGKDTLYGQVGNDTLDGGAGDDMLDGGAGNDTYLFGKGSGKDTISANDGTVGKLDVIQLGADVLTTDVALKRDSDALVLSINGTADALRVNNYFYNDATYGFQVEQVKFADGTVWDVAAIKSRVATGSGESDMLYGYATADTLSGLAGDDTLYAKAGNDTLDGGAGEDRLFGEDGDDILKGGTQNDTLYGGNGADSLQGQEGNDPLSGDAGNDTLDGGAGDDMLDGGAGNDTYLFGKGSGKDTISANDGTVGKLDVIQLGADVLTTDVALKRDSDALVLSINGTADALRVNNYFYNDATYGFQVEQVKFADGTVWDVAAIKSRVATGSGESDMLYGYATADTLSGLAGDDTLYAKAGNDTLDGGAGEDRLFGEDGDDILKGGTQNDTLYGGNGADSLQGQEGNDPLSGDAGNDTLDGGAGDDMLDGGAGNDTYLFGKGSGKDTISANDGTVGKLDVIQLGADVLTTDVALKRDSDALVLSINGTADALRVNNYFYNDATYGFQVEQVKFADGTVWDVAAIKSRVATGSGENDMLYGYATADTLSGLAGDDTLYAKAGNDTLDGGAGEDRLFGEDGDDILKGGTQNDTLYGGNGADSLQGQEGNDPLSGDAGNDTLDGGAGDDMLDGGAGNDTYLFGKGSGKDTISANDGTVGKLDVIQLGADVLTTDVALKRDSDALVLSINGTADALRVNNYFYNDATYGFQVEQVKFADGTVWDVAAIKSRVATGSGENDMLYGYATADTLSGLAGDDTLYAKAGNDTLDGGAGEDRLFGEDGDDILKGGTQNDTLYGGNGADSLQGQEGNDTLSGDAGNDTLDGGAGNDTLNGGLGNDSYLFGRGLGQDTINDYDSTTGSADLLQFGAGISSDQLWFRRVGSSLEISVIGTDDRTTIQSWYSGNAYHVEQFKTADGKMLLDGQVESLISAMAAFEPPVSGQATLPPSYQATLTPVIAANWQ